MKRFQQHLREFDLRLQMHEELNPALWDEGDKLKPAVRSKLMALAERFAEHSKVPFDGVSDVLMTGGNANYNWTPYSDIDVHIRVERSSYGLGALTDEYFKDKKTLWTLEHNVKVAGFPVELYAQDASEGAPDGQGVYSLKHDHWLIFPKKQVVDFEDRGLRTKVSHFQSVIDHLVHNQAPTDQFVALKKRLGNMRSAGLAKGGEFARENLVFKALRNLGYLQKMNDYLRNSEDRELSL